MPTIVFNGKSYNSPDEMPDNERKAYEQMMGMFMDKNGNGIPDLLEGDLVKNVLTAHATMVNINGKTVSSLDELPPDVRQKVDGAFQMLSNMGILTDATADSAQSEPVSYEPQIVSKPITAQSSNVLEEDRGTSIFSIIIISALVCFGLTAATIAVWVFMNR